MSTVDRVEEAIIEALLSGDYSPGTWLRQDEVASKLGVSKIPVREALQRLAAASLVTFEPNRGAMVRPLSADDAEEIFALRCVIEPELMRRAIGRHTIVDLASAEHALAAPGTVTQKNWQFHRALYLPAAWPRALSVVRTLHAVVAPYVLLYTVDLGGGTRSDTEHAQLLEHCRTADAESALGVLSEHLRSAAEASHSYLTAG